MPATAKDIYIFTTAGAACTIEIFPYTTLSRSNSKTYGDADPSPVTTGSGSNFVAADNVTASNTSTVDASDGPTSYYIICTLRTTGISALDNYIITNAVV